MRSATRRAISGLTCGEMNPSSDAPDIRDVDEVAASDGAISLSLDGWGPTRSCFPRSGLHRLPKCRKAAPSAIQLRQEEITTDRR